VEDGVAGRLRQEIRTTLLVDNSVRLRSPAHDSIQLAMRELPGKIVFSESIPKEELTSMAAGELPEELRVAADLVLDDGPSGCQQLSTIVRVCDHTWSVARPGAVSVEQLRNCSAFQIIFVCTGNTCRSPLAEALCKKLLAEELRYPIEKLAEYGFLVISAGLAAMMGGGAAPEAVQVAQELGADLSGHRTRLLTRELATKADCLVAMTNGHLLSIAYQFPEAAQNCQLLRTDGADVADPIGSEMEVYRRSAQEIAEQLGPLISTWIKKRSGE
jgi:protein-tyrosine phosphatase